MWRASARIRQYIYTSVPSVLLSDHKPVVAYFELDLSNDGNLLTRLGQKLRQHNAFESSLGDPL